ncbi:protein O-linked-mannose beta-1,2-N-acetylglucosaminyltransferase 1-like [Argopecten irradians]|uniref:protein O-linked-mannose beta-1,2-N-acetylglucosaminyltransferase 1-like n=1 Tax=Argopecten irradians TaxID=31199 RepID=UPI00371DCBF3
MDTWVPNPNARPYIPKKYRHGRQPGSNKRGFSTRKCVVKTFQGGLVVVLLFTVVINIMFIVETSKKLKDPQFRAWLSERYTVGNHTDGKKTDQISSSDDYDEIGAGRKKEKVVEMSMSTSLNVEVMSSKTAAFISVDGTTVSISYVVLVQRSVSVMWC